MSGDEQTSTANSTANNFPIPVDTDQKEIKCRNNLAYIHGTLDRVENFLNRSGYFKRFLAHRAVACKTTLAIPDATTALFIKGTYKDKYDFKNPCPEDIGARVLAYNDAKSLSDPVATVIDTVPDALDDFFTVAEWLCDDEDAKLCRMLTYTSSATSTTSRTSCRRPGRAASSSCPSSGTRAPRPPSATRP